MLLFSLEKMNSELQLTINYPASLSSNPLFFEEYAKFLRSIRELSEQKTPSPSTERKISPATGCKVTQSPQVGFREALQEAGRSMTLPSLVPTEQIRDVKKASYRRRREGPTLNREVPIVSPNACPRPVYSEDLKNCPYSEKEDFFEKEILDVMYACIIRSGLQMSKEFVLLMLRKHLSKEQSEKVYSILLEAIEIIENKKLFSINKIIKDAEVRSVVFKIILI